MRRITLARASGAAAQRERGDHDLDAAAPPPPPYRPAAVLVPIVDRPEGLTVLLTQRTDHLADHAGQISFPGGRIEPEDATPEDAALREAREEIGLDARHVHVIGRLDLYRTTTGFEVVPVVGLIHPAMTLRPDPREVADVFEVPLDFLIDPANRERRSREWRGATRSFYVMPYLGRHIWGATAGMLVDLAERLSDAEQDAE
jgi:8-oxo-dGTP pyrophosphatase MutT (NUDIX family)